MRFMTGLNQTIILFMHVTLWLCEIVLNGNAFWVLGTEEVTCNENPPLSPLTTSSSQFLKRCFQRKGNWKLYPILQKFSPFKNILLLNSHWLFALKKQLHWKKLHPDRLTVIFISTSCTVYFFASVWHFSLAFVDITAYCVCVWVCIVKWVCDLWKKDNRQPSILQFFLSSLCSDTVGHHQRTEIVYSLTLIQFFINFTHSLVFRKKCRVPFGNCSSAKIDITFGVHQGSCQSLCLFSLYVFPLGSKTREHGIDFSLLSF